MARTKVTPIFNGCPGPRPRNDGDGEKRGGGRGGRRGGGARGGGRISGKREMAPETRGSAKRVTRQSAEEARRAGRSVDVREGLPNDYKVRRPKSKKKVVVKVEKGEVEKKNDEGCGVGEEKGGGSAGAQGGSDAVDKDKDGGGGGGEAIGSIEIVASQETVFQKAAEDLKSALSDALPDVPVQIVEGLKGNFEIRKKGEEETFLQHKDLKRPFKELKDMNAKKVAADIAKRWATQEEQS